MIIGARKMCKSYAFEVGENLWCRAETWIFLRGDTGCFFCDDGCFKIPYNEVTPKKHPVYVRLGRIFCLSLLVVARKVRGEQSRL